MLYLVRLLVPLWWLVVCWWCWGVGSMSLPLERDAVYTVDMLAEVLGVGRRTIERALSRGELRARRVGRLVLFIGAEVIDNLPPYVGRKGGPGGE